MKGRSHTLSIALGIIVIHVGTNDVAKGSPTLVHDMEHLITNIQIKASRAEIHLSSICPRRDNYDQEVIQINRDLKSLSEKLDCSFINHGNGFRYMDGSVDATVFHDKVHLNTKGTGKLVRRIQSEVFQLDKSLYSDSRDSNTGDTDTTWKTVQSRGQSRQQRNRNSQRYHNHSYHGHRSHNTYRSKRTNNISNQRACHYCGESNHTTNKCRYDKPLSCHNCGSTGHKKRNCFKN